MKQIFLRDRVRYLWILGDLAVIAAFYGTRHQRALMNAVADGITGPLKRALGAVCAVVPFSVGEVLIGLSLAALAVYLVWLGITLFRRRWWLLYVGILRLACVLLTLYAVLCLLWGVNYHTDRFQDRSGLYAAAVDPQQLETVTMAYADTLNRLSGQVARDDNGVFAVPREEIYADAPAIYRGAETVYPFLRMKEHVPKRVFFSRLMSRGNFTGLFFPFTGEANLNDDSPACLLPATIAHEMAHQRGFASEQECNFIAVLACEKSGNPVYAYSGALFGFIHLSNALHQADSAAWEEIHRGLNAQVRADLSDNNAYWAQFESKTAEVSQDVYDSFLKSNGEESGIESYGEVVELLAAWYRQEH